jgi:hypothetical protein
LEAELLEFAQAFESKGGIGILNDLTHFLKLGDITIRKDEGTFEIVEVKAGQKWRGRITRQKQALRETVAFLNTGEKEGAEEKLTIRQLDVKPESFIGHVRKIVETAQKEGASVERIGDHLIIECTDFQKAGEIGIEETKGILKKARDGAENWRKNGDIVVDLISQEKYMDVRNYAPFSIFPLPALARVKLITEALLIITYVNISAVVRYFEQKGWKIVKSPQEHIEELLKQAEVREMSLATVKKGPLTVAVPFLWFGRVGFEFLKPRTLVDVLEAKLSEGPPENGSTSHFANLNGEPNIWD